MHCSYGIMMLRSVVVTVTLFENLAHGIATSLLFASIIIRVHFIIVLGTSSFVIGRFIGLFDVQQNFLDIRCFRCDFKNCVGTKHFHQFLEVTLQLNSYNELESIDFIA